MSGLHNRDLLVQAVRSVPTVSDTPARDRQHYPPRSTEFRDRVLALRSAGATYTQIGEQLQVTRNVVAGVLARHSRGVD